MASLHITQLEMNPLHKIEGNLKLAEKVVAYGLNMNERYLDIIFDSFERESMESLMTFMFVIQHGIKSIKVTHYSFLLLID
jgi:hypothetical protein